MLAIGTLTVAAGAGARERAPAPDPRPNILVVLTDDQTLDTLPTEPPAMPWLQSQLQDPNGHWVWFPNAIASTPLCCPSRATILAGQFDTRTHVRDNNGDPGTSPAGFLTSSPIVVWSPVPGASSYQVDVDPFNVHTRPGDCDFNWNEQSDHWQVLTAVPAWTPLAGGKQAPFPTSINVSQDFQQFVAGRSYCVRVRARTDRSNGTDVWGDYTYLSNAFTFAGYPGGCSCAVSATAGTYAAPIGGQVTRSTPLLAWREVPGAASYYVIVAKDPSFTTVVDYAFTREPAYAPRDSSNPRTYPDETTNYYWAVLPSGAADGAGAASNPLAQAPASFQKRSIPPTLQSPANGTKVIGPPTFRWTAVEGARYYKVQVSQDQNFGTTLLDEQVTDSTAYTSTKTFPANAALYVRVRAEDETNTGLSWSSVRSFKNVLPSPRPHASPRGDLIPTFTWSPVPRAVAYDFHAQYPDGSTHDNGNLRSPAFTPPSLSGTGVFHWQVRAEFPQVSGGPVPGPYSSLVTFTRTILPPAGARSAGGGKSVLYTWQPKLGAKSYRIQVSRSPDFSQQVENQEVHSTFYAPNLDSYGDGGTFCWHVQAVDADGNSGNYTQTRSFALQKRT